MRTPKWVYLDKLNLLNYCVQLVQLVCSTIQLVCSTIQLVCSTTPTSLFTYPTSLFTYSYSVLNFFLAHQLLWSTSVWHVSFFYNFLFSTPTSLVNSVARVYHRTGRAPFLDTSTAMLDHVPDADHDLTLLGPLYQSPSFCSPFCINVHPLWINVRATPLMWTMI